MNETSASTATASTRTADGDTAPEPSGDEPVRRFSVAVFPGDGIGDEITAPTVALLHRACERVGGVALDTAEHPAGARAWQTHGDALPADSMAAARAADAILLAAMGDPAIRYPDGTEITPQLDLRFRLGLYAGLRPIRSIPGVPGPLADPRARDIDFVLVRESVEGLFARLDEGTVTDDEARETLVITREGSERLFRATFALAASRARRRAANGEARAARVTCIDKANVFRAFAFFRKLFDAEATHHDVRCDHAYVDIMSLNLVTRPWDYDVMVTENMFGDILSDLAAALVGGMGYAPSADVGDSHAVFQPCHGSAPDIAGRGLANPTAMFLSGAMMLDWLGERHDVPAANRAARLVERAVDAAFEDGALRTTELGGSDGLDAVTDAVSGALERLPLPAA